MTIRRWSLPLVVILKKGGGWGEKKTKKEQIDKGAATLKDSTLPYEGGQASFKTS